MDYQSLHIKTVVELRALAKASGVKLPAGVNKSAIIDRLLEADRAAEAAKSAKPVREKAPEAAKPQAGKASESAEPAKPVREKASEAAKPQAGKASESAEPAKPVREKAPETVKPQTDKVSESAGPAGAKKPARRGRPPKAAKAAESVAVRVKTPAQEEKPAKGEDSAKGETLAKVEAPVKSEMPVKGEGSAKGETPTKGGASAKGETLAKGERPVKGGASAKSETPVKVDAPAMGEASAKPEAASQGETAGKADVEAPAVRGRSAMSFRSYPRPQQGEERHRVAQGWNRQGQGDNRERRFGGTNPRYSRNDRQGGWENREGQRRPAPAAGAVTAESAEAEPQRQRPEGYYNAEYRTSNPATVEMLTAGECGDGAGVLELQPDGYGFLRAENCLPGPNDVYISIAQIRRFGLRSGDHVVGKTRAQREGDRYSAMMYITEVNGESPEKAAERPRFEDLVPIYPDQRLRLEPPEGKGDLSLRLIDMLAPIGKGQRGMIVSQPKAGKTTLLKKVANAISAGYPDAHLIVLLIDERPEEVTDMQRSIQGEVIYSTFDEEPEHHTRVSEMVLARAQRLVEMGKDVVLLLDSITRLARAYNLTITPTGRSLSGGLDPGALFKPKRFFGAARNIEGGGSLTIIATALVETGSRMDDIIFEEFKGTGNMELHLDRKLSDRRVFPAIDLLKSGTRREELLLSEDEMNGEYQVRRMLGGRQQEMYEQLIDLLTKTASNAEFFTKLKGWLAVYEKEGYTLGR